MDATHDLTSSEETRDGRAVLSSEAQVRECTSGTAHMRVTGEIETTASRKKRERGDQEAKRGEVSNRGGAGGGDREGKVGDRKKRKGNRDGRQRRRVRRVTRRGGGPGRGLLRRATCEDRPCSSAPRGSRWPRGTRRPCASARGQRTCKTMRRRDRGETWRPREIVQGEMVRPRRKRASQQRGRATLG